MKPNRRSFLAALGGAALAPAAGLSLAAQTPSPQAPVSPVPLPRDWSRLEPLQYPDPDLVALDNRFRRYIVGNTSIKRLHIGTLWAEGPAWNGVGRYLVWSDIPNNVQMRWIEEDARVTVFRNPSGPKKKPRRLAHWPRCRSRKSPSSKMAMPSYCMKARCRPMLRETSFSIICQLR